MQVLQRLATKEEQIKLIQKIVFEEFVTTPTGAGDLTTSP